MTTKLCSLVEELTSLYLDRQYAMFITKWKSAYKCLTVQQQLSLRRRLLTDWRSTYLWEQLM